MTGPITPEHLDELDALNKARATATVHMSAAMAFDAMTSLESLIVAARRGLEAEAAVKRAPHAEDCQRGDFLGVSLGLACTCWKAALATPTTDQEADR